MELSRDEVMKGLAEVGSPWTLARRSYDPKGIRNEFW
jgi:hypothetical protein